MAKPSLRIIGFCCQNALSGEQELAGRVLFEPTIKIISLPCSSKVETLAIMKGFESGVDGIFALGCPDGKCHLLGGNYRARKIVNYTKQLLDDIGIESSRLEMFQLGTSEYQSFDRVAKAMAERIKSLGKA
jgi:coenzyme F420-reducing hydrogenase delta subunit